MNLLHRVYFILVLLFIFAIPAWGEEVQASEISGLEAVTDYSNMRNYAGLFDEDLFFGYIFPKNSSITLTDDRGIASFYFIFDIEPGEYTVTDMDTEESITCGGSDFLHEYVDLKAAFNKVPHSIRISFPGKTQICELRLFTEGKVPEDVQIWQLPTPGKADLVLFSTHGDDEQLFFAGILPYYAGELDYEVVVAYFTSHRPIVYHRTHEMLNGLYAVGLRNYPVFGPFPDYFSLSKEKSYSLYAKAGVSKDQMLSYVVEQLRKFRPKVAIGHDVNGEYGHGAHRMYSELLREAVELAAREDIYTQSLEAWGSWDTPKTYLHLYADNPIVMDWDQPLSAFDGMTAFEVTRDLGFREHQSQFKDYWWYYDGYPTAASIEGYSPCRYGLFRSLVGPDINCNDFFENNIGYTQELRNAEEIARRVQEELEEEEHHRQEAASAPTQTEPNVQMESAADDGLTVIYAGIAILLTTCVGTLAVLKKRS